MNYGRHEVATATHGRKDKERKLTAPWRWMVSRIGKPMAVAVVIIMLAALAAFAAIILRAEVTGSAESGDPVAFEWAKDLGGGTYGDGVLTTRYAVDADSDGLYEDWGSAGVFPSPLGCVATVTGGVLDVDLTGGWLPGEGCIIQGSFLYNPSSVDVDIISWDFTGSDLGLLGSGSETEVYITTSGTGDLNTDIGLPASVAANTAVSPGQVIFRIDDQAAFSTIFSFDGAAVVGNTTR